TDTTDLVYLVIEHMMEPVDHTFPRVHFTSPTAEMSQADLEFRWAALRLVTNWLPYGEGEFVHLREEYWDELCKRLSEAMFGSLAIEYFSPTDGEVHWPSVNMLVASEILRGAKALESLKASNESPVSSLTEAYVLLRGVSGMMSWCTPEPPIPTVAHYLYTLSKASQLPEHMVYRIRYLQICAQRHGFIAVAGSRFLHQRQGNPSIQEERYIKNIKACISAEQCRMRYTKGGIRHFQEELSRLRLVHMPSNSEGQFQHVISEIAKLKAEVNPPYYEEEQTISEIRSILGVAPQSLEYLLDDTGLPDAVISLLALQSPRENVYLQNSPYLALAADYHLLLLWRCMKPLSLLQWFINRYGAVPENHGFISEQVNGAVTEIASMAQYILEIFDAYEEAAGELHGKPRTSRLSVTERQQCLGLLGGNRLASTWEGIIRKDAYKYITAVKSALANIENFYVPPADVDLPAHIQYVDGIPPGINLLISAYPVPENLQPRHLELATKLHCLVVHRLRSVPSSPNCIDRLDAFIGERMQLFSAYNQVSRVLPDIHTFSWGKTGPNTGAQRDILDPATSIYSGAYDFIESGLGTRTRAVSEGSFSAGGSRSKRNRYAGRGPDIGDCSGSGRRE
ncbi:hypothetical protein SeLEV6574_g07684, partial [Synchytrium endobioticum]